jgi:uncharacterized protein (TIGR01370 family)
MAGFLRTLRRKKKIVLGGVALLFSIVLGMPAWAIEKSLIDKMDKPSTTQVCQSPEKWAVYYGEALPAESFLPYDLVVFDSIKHPPLRPLQNRDKTLLGYLSVGEAETYRQDFDKVQSLGVLLGENKDWPGHYVVDIRNPKWTKYLIEEKIPQILFQRFDGIMLDTIESAVTLEMNNPQKYAGMKAAAVQLLRAIRMHYPDIKIMLNRGFDVLPHLADQIDMVLAESILVNAADPQKPVFFPDAVYDELTGVIREAQAVNPKLKVYALDYWLTGEKDTVKTIYERHRANGFIPYVSTVDLQQVVAEPQ